jgi:Site-specific DNA methylase
LVKIENGEDIYSDARTLTLYELMLIMSLPGDWPLPDDTNEAFVRRIIGEGIPPLFVKKLFNCYSRMKKLRGLSLFSNVGIAEAGLTLLDVDMIYANELIKDRADFYSSVHPETEMIQGDITNDDLRSTIVKKAER